VQSTALSYPTIGWLDLQQFCVDLKILDQRLTPANLQLNFTAACNRVKNSEEGGPSAQEPHPSAGAYIAATMLELQSLRAESSLQRFEFLEVLLRIAG